MYGFVHCMNYLRMNLISNIRVLTVETNVSKNLIIFTIICNSETVCWIEMTPSKMC